MFIELLKKRYPILSQITRPCRAMNSPAWRFAAKMGLAVNYALNLRQAARPAKPEPNRSMAEGTGTGGGAWSM